MGLHILLQGFLYNNVVMKVIATYRAEVRMLLTCIQEVLGSKLDRNTIYFEFHLEFPQSLRANNRDFILKQSNTASTFLESIIHSAPCNETYCQYR
jgi:hypothetical protein